MPENVKIPVLYFHSVAPYKHPDWIKSFLTLEVDYFESVIKMLAGRKYNFLFLDEYLDIRNNPELAGKGKYACLTFDDGYLDNYVFAYPILKKHGAKGTIFVNPALVQKEKSLRANLDDLAGRGRNPSELEFLGFCNWGELEAMDKSGVIDVQSHTLTHTKVFSGNKVREFHHPKANWLYPIGNLFPERLPYYAADKGFERLLPYGSPFFEEKSSLISRIHHINPEFEAQTVEALSSTDWDRYDWQDSWNRVCPIYEAYRQKDELISHIESEAEYQERIRREIFLSKQILEEKLKKQVHHLCWPHGDYTKQCHELALEAGYRSSLLVRRNGGTEYHPDRFDRIGVGSVVSSKLLTNFRLISKIGYFRGQFPFGIVAKVFHFLKNA